jgi:hypothetical protein
VLPHELTFPRLASSLSLFWYILANITCYQNSFSGALPGVILADATQSQPSSLFGSLASGVVSFVEAAANMAHSRATTPARGTTPARQRGTTPSAAMDHRTITASAMKGMNISMVNESRPRLLGGMPVSFCGDASVIDRHYSLSLLTLQFNPAF